MTDSQETTAWIKAMPVVFVLIWSTGFIVARYGMPHAPPFSFLLVRYLLSILCFLPWIVLARVKWPQSRSQWLHLAVTGILMHAGYLGGVWAAVKAGMGSGLSSLIVGIQPVLTAIWLTSVGGQHVSRRQWVGLLLGFAGLVLVVSHKFESGGPGDTATWLNLSFAVIALFSITAGTLYQKRYCPRFDLRTGSVLQFLPSLAITALIASRTETMVIAWTGDFVFALGWLVLVLSVGAISLLNLLIRSGSAVNVASLFYLTPPTTALIAWAMFGETLSALAIAGMSLAVSGVWLARKG